MADTADEYAAMNAKAAMHPTLLDTSSSVATQQQQRKQNNQSNTPSTALNDGGNPTQAVEQPEEKEAPLPQRDLYTNQCQPRNEELQSAVKNSCGAIYPLQVELRAIMAEWNDRWSSWCADNAKQVRSFDEELRYYHKKAYSEAQLDETYACHLKTEWLDQYLKRVRAVQEAVEAEKRAAAEREAAAEARRYDGLSAEEIELMKQEQESLEDEERDNQPPLSPNTMRKAANARNRRVSFSGLHDELTRLFFGPVKKQKITHQVEDVNETLFPFNGHELVTYTMQNHDNVHADPLNLLRAEFAKSLAVVAANETNLAQLLDERDGFIAQERVVEAEAKTKTAIEVFTDTLHIVYSRFKQAITAGVDVKEFTEHVAAVGQGTDQKVAEAKAEAEEVKQKAEQDLKNLREMMRQFRETARQQLTMFETKREESNNKLKQNTLDQQHAWSVIMNQLAKLKDLCVERESIVGDHMLATEKEQERVQLNSEIEAVCAAREDDLTAALDNAKQALEYSESVAKLSEFVRTSVKEKAFPEKLQKYQVDEALRFQDVYKRYVLFAGRALFLRQQRLENIRRLVRATEFQIQSAAETLDAELPNYRTQLVGFKGTEHTLKAESTSLSEQMEKESGYWDEVEHFLEEQHVSIEAPPSLAMQELQRDLMRSHVEAVDMLTTTEQRLLDNEKASVRKMHNACVAAKEVIQEKHRHRSTLLSASAMSADSLAHQQQQQQSLSSPAAAAADNNNNQNSTMPSPIPVTRTPMADADSRPRGAAAAGKQLDYN